MTLRQVVGWMGALAASMKKADNEEGAAIRRA